MLTLPYRILAVLALLAGAFASGWIGHVRYRAESMRARRWPCPNNVAKLKRSPTAKPQGSMMRSPLTVSLLIVALSMLLPACASSPPACPVPPPVPAEMMIPAPPPQSFVTWIEKILSRLPGKPTQ